MLETVRGWVPGRARLAAGIGLALLAVSLGVVGRPLVNLRGSPDLGNSIPPHPTLPRALAASGRAAEVQLSQLWVSDEAGDFRAIVRAPDGGYVQDPAWRPDGGAIAFARIAPIARTTSEQSSSDLRFSSEIWSVDDQGRTKLLLGDQGDGSRVSQPTWSADAASLYFVREISYREGGIAGVTRRIERLDVATGRRSVVADDGIWPVVAPDGRRLAFVKFDPSGSADLWVIDLQTGESRRLTDGRFVSVSSPRFSADSQTVAFGGGQWATQGQETPPASPDLVARLESWLAPTAFAHEYLSALWLIGVDGDKMRQVGNDFYDVPVVRWTADPIQLLLYDEDGLFQVDLTSRRRQVVFPKGDYLGFDWLPLSAR